VADRRGDVLLAQGKPDEARQAFQAAYGMDEKLDYRAWSRPSWCRWGARRARRQRRVGGRPVMRAAADAGAALLLALAVCWRPVQRQAQAHAAGSLHAAHRRPPGLDRQRRRHRVSR
jgi:hypothetical protein